MSKAIETQARDSRGRFQSKNRLPVPESRTVSFALPGTDGLTAVVTVRRNGQENPAEGDRVRAMVTVELPATPKRTCYLHKALRFENRVQICGESLYSIWGGNCDTKHHRYFKATTWREALAAAEEYGTAEVSKLMNALQARQDALAAAEE